MTPHKNRGDPKVKSTCECQKLCGTIPIGGCLRNDEIVTPLSYAVIKNRTEEAFHDKQNNSSVLVKKYIENMPHSVTLLKIYIHTQKKLKNVLSTQSVLSNFCFVSLNFRKCLYHWILSTLKKYSSFPHLGFALAKRIHKTKTGRD